MPTVRNFAGASYSIPNNREPKGWGAQASAFLIAVADNAIPKTGGLNTLSAELNFGASYGVLLPYIKSAAANIAAAGVVRLARSDTVSWRNQANSADLALAVDASNVLSFNSIPLSTVPASLAAHIADVANPHAVTKTQVGLANVDNTSDATKNAAVATLTNKTLLTPVIDDYADINEEAAPSTPASGKVRLYAKTDKKLYTKDSAGTEIQVGASGSGEINALTTGSQDATGWLAGTSHSVATNTANSPLSPIVSTCIAITATANGTESSTSGGYKTLTMPTGLLGKKLKCEFFVTTPAADTWRLSVYQGTTRLSLTTDSSSVSSLPAGVTGKYTAYVDTNNNTGYTVSLTRTAGSGTTTAYVTQVIVGPGVQPQGAVVGPWLSYSPTVSAGWVSNSNATGRYRQVGESIEVVATVSVTGAVTSDLTITLPSGLTFDVSKLSTTTGYSMALGSAVVLDSGVRSYVGVATYGGSTIVHIINSESGNIGVTGAGAPFTFASGDQVTVSFSAPISQWAGSGTVNLAQNDVTFYAPVTTGSITIGTSNAGTPTINPAGSAMPNITSADTTNGTTDFLILPAGVLQDGDKWSIEVKSGGIWYDGEKLYAPNQQGSASYGFRPYTSGGAVYLGFGRAGTAPNTTLSTTSAAPWSTQTGNSIRVRVQKGGQAVGFGEVVPGISSGLVASAGLKGRTDGGTVATGYVGEKLTFTLGATAWAASSTVGNVGSFSLPAGTWLLMANWEINTSATTVAGEPGSAGAWWANSTSQSEVPAQNTRVQNLAINAGANGTARIMRQVLPNYYISQSATTTHYVNALNQYSTLGGATNTVYVTVVRLA